MNKHFLIALSFLFTGIAMSPAQDPVFNTVKTELNRNFKELSAQPIPAYYGFVRLDEVQAIHTSANLGRLQQEATLQSPSRIVTACLRVGDYTLDNSHELRESGGGGSGIHVRGNYIPYEFNDRLLRNSIWLQLDELYKEGIQTYEQVKANLAAKVKQEDTSPDFSHEPVINHYEQPLAWADLKIDPKVWEEKVRKYSALFDENDDLQEGVAYFSTGLSRIIFVDTEGREMAQNAVNIQLVVSAHTIAEDGMDLPLAKSWRAFSLDELPSDEEVLQAAREISATLSALRKAPVVESFTGPAILSPEAAGVFFHEIFGHRVEGARLKQENDAQTFKKKIGEVVLPKHLSVTFDPTLRYYESKPLTGYYAFDDEGIPAQKVEVVKNGILNHFLMSRTPIEGHSHSNGHGRSGIGYPPISRQSNMLIQSSQRFSDEDLIKKLRKEAKAQKKEYAYYFKDVSGGFTNTSRYSPNSFNVTPLIVYRIYTDGRPNELVRGVDMVGTPLAMFSQIEACGDRYAIFNGMCGAESGSIPVSCVAPALFVKQIETQKRPKNQTPPILLPKPEPTSSDSSLPDDTVLLKAMKKEVNRGLNNLKMDGLQSPFFIAYTIGDIRQLWITASHGSLTNSKRNHSRASNARLLMGDYQCTDENFEGTTGGASGYDGSPIIDNDDRGIRYTIWKDLDAIYKSAAETYEQKMATIKQLNIPPKDLELPDWDKTPVVKPNHFPKQNLDFNPSRYEEYAQTASSVFNEYPEILGSNLVVQLFDATIYFYNTEGSEFTYPLSFVYVSCSVNGKTEEGEDLSDSFDFVYAHSDELPPVKTMQAECRKLAADVIEEMHAPKLKDAYSGPILFEGLAVPTLFYTGFFGGNNISLIAERKPLTTTGFSYGGNGIEEMMGKRITAREITIEDLTGTPEYNGVKLFGYAPIDGQGVVPPARLTLVENGLLMTLLSDRIPTPKVPHSNGHALLGPALGSGINTGVIRLSDTRTKTYAELKKELLNRAQQEGYDYAYIVRKISGSSPHSLYKVNLSDGSETRVRSAEINNLDTQIFKKIIGVSNKELIYNTIAGNLLTTITPDAILFDDMQIQSDRIDHFKKAPLTPNHLSSSIKEKE
ncbi:MAG: TldD/PmbA family protein [Dysgonamonadaceae bacterium]|jgi:predicted Zn-dependent protease|nr:TldD/PmbA family protein [Dysgonamonadaceae bacterium]